MIMKSIKNFIFVTLSCVVISFISYAHDNKKDIFLWDIHDVIIARDAKKTLTILWEFNNKINLFSNCNSRLFKGSLSFLWRQIIDAGNGSVAELIDLAEKEKNTYLVDFILQIANAYKPIYGTWEIIKELYENGYTHHIGSNISKPAFIELINPDKTPSLAPIFTYFNLSNPQIVYATNENKFIKKPSRQFFEHYLKNNHIDLKKSRIIFIDDNKDNIIAAAGMGFVAILFKNPEQLRADLCALGIQLNEQPVSLFGV